MQLLISSLKVLADLGRLRLVRLLLLEESLNVGELVRILGLSQSSVSQKLAELKRAGLVRERRAGGFTYHELAPGTGAAFDRLAAEIRAAPDEHGDLARLAEVRREREERGGTNGKLVEPGRSWVAWARALRFVIPRLRVADFGCGDGALTVEIAAFAAHVDAIEKSAAALARARERAARAGLTNLSFHLGEVETVALPPRRHDLVVVSQMLHHVADPEAALARAQRLLRPGGRVLVLELGPHGEEWVREKLGHVHLGFSPQALEKHLVQSGLGDVQVEPGPRARREPFRILIATGVRP